MSSDLKEASQRQGSFLQTMKAVAWSFFGVRKSSDYAQDVAKINLIHVIVAGIIAAIVFVAIMRATLRHEPCYADEPATISRISFVILAWRALL